jgi:hypothetical protein
MNYATIDRELLCVVATLHEFCSLLLDVELHVHRDHKNNFNIGDCSQQRLCQIFYVDKCGPEFNYLEGPPHVIADTFSMLLRIYVISPLVGKKATNVVIDSERDNKDNSLCSSMIDDRDIIDCLLNLLCFPPHKEKKKRHPKCSKISDRGNKSALLPSASDEGIIISISLKTWSKTTL